MAFEQYGFKDYNQSSYWQQVVGLKYVDLFTESIAPITNKPLVEIADYGCSEGANSIIFFNKVIQALKNRLITSAISITHCDLPDNDWSSLNNLLITSESSYLKQPSVYSSNIGRSFYNQLFPSNSIDVGHSAFSLHYLSNQDENQSKYPELNHLDAPRKAFLDMYKLLTLRIEELVPSGHFFAIVGFEAEERPIVAAEIMNKTFGKMIENGFLTAEEMGNFKLAVELLKRSEWDQLLDVLKTKAKVVHFSTEKSICPYYTEYLHDNDIEKLVEGVSRFYYVLIENSVKCCLKRENKDLTLKNFKEELKNAIRDHVAEIFFYVVVLILQKNSD